MHRFQSELIPATLLRRYKRFLADCRLPDGSEVTAHIANPGAMTGLDTPGIRIWIEPNDDPRKKLKYAWRLIEHENGHFTGVDTGAANRIVKQALRMNSILELSNYDSITPEARYGENSRIDFLLRARNLPDCYLEVKSVTLSRCPQIAEFPDCVTARGTKHLRELAAMRAQGHRTVMLYLVQRTDCTHACLARDIDPAYASAFDTSTKAGLETLAFGCTLSPMGAALAQRLTFTQ